jgi:hypothetical protein
MLPEPAPGEPCWMPWYREVAGQGIVVQDGEQLQPDVVPTTVRLAGAEVLVSDGPFAETKEQILGYQVIQCASLDEAVYTASRHPVAGGGGRIEIRPITNS